MDQAWRGFNMGCVGPGGALCLEGLGLGVPDRQEAADAHLHQQMAPKQRFVCSFWYRRCSEGNF